MSLLYQLTFLWSLVEMKVLKTQAPGASDIFKIHNVHLSYLMRLLTASVEGQEAILKKEALRVDWYTFVGVWVIYNHTLRIFWL